MCWSWNKNRWWRPSNTARRRRKETDPFWLILCPCPRLLWRTEYSRPQKQAPDTKNSSPAKKPSIWRSSVPLASWIPVKNRFQRSRDCDLFSVCFFFTLQRLDSLLIHIRSCYLQLDHLGINYFKDFMQLRNNVLSQSVIFFFHHYSPFDNEKSFNVDV